VALVTGATRGLGRAMALELAQRGMRLVLAARSTEQRPNRVLPGTLEDIERAIGASGAECLAIAADVGKEEDVARLVAAAHERFGRVDVLINNAAVSFVGPFLDVPPSKWRAAIGVDLLGPVMLCHGVLPGMLQRGSGRILSLSSSAVLDDGVLQLPYAVAKTGLERLTTGLHHQFGERGIAVSCIRIDEVIPTEAVGLHAPHLVDAALLGPAEFAHAVAWVLEQRVEDVGGRVLTLSGLRASGALRQGQTGGGGTAPTSGPCRT
jgi:NAD(P)-dependent dehydrogenase (short-subunit alcohol dehydrogenase family)